MKSISLTVLLIFAIGCSESTEFFAKNSKSSPTQSASEIPAVNPTIIATPDQLIGTPLVVDEGLVLITTDGSSKPGTLEITNIDPKNTYIIEYKLEKEETITRVSIPDGKTPTKEDIKPGTTLKIPVIFKPNGDTTVVIDQVVIEYTKKDDPSDVHTIIYPIRGEVKKPIVVVEPKIEIIPTSVTITTISGQPIQDFGTTVIGKPIEGKVVITNTSKEPIKIDLRIEKDDSFRIKNPKECPEVLKVDETCTIIVVLDTKTPGTHQDHLMIEHGSLKRDDREMTKIPLIAIKIEDLETCGDKPCGKPFKEGTLISSEVFSNDIDFGSVSIGTVINKQVEIQNKGDVALTIKDHKLDDQGVFSFSGGQFPGESGTCSDILRPGSCVIEISYRPLEVRADIGSLYVKSSEGPSLKLSITGLGSAQKSCDTTNDYLIVPEKSFPASRVIFPYLKSKAGTGAKLEQLYGMQVNSFVPEIKDHTVKDGMVYITFNLPAMEGEITSMNFGVNVYKVIRDNFKDTESLCLSSQDTRKCSGHEFSLASWQKLKNPAFWDLFKTPVNDLYEKQLVSGENKCGSKDCLSLNTRYELKDIFNLSVKEFQSIRNEGTFTLIFSDDTRMLTMPRISVKTKIKKECI
jgi:hypothetical protein